MDEFDPARIVRSYLSEAEHRLLNCLVELPAAASQVAREKASEEIRQATATLKQRAEALIALLSRMPHHVAELVLANFLDPATARRLTRGEAAHAREAFGDRAVPLARKAYVSFGPGKNPAAMVAFLNNNPAITIGNSMYFVPSRWSANFASSRDTIPLFLHEFTQVIQWDRLGHAAFLRRYRREARAAGGADHTYEYRNRQTDFGHEMLEGQAQMVEDQAKFRHQVFGESESPSCRPETQAGRKRRLWALELR